MKITKDDIVRIHNAAKSADNLLSLEAVVAATMNHFGMTGQVNLDRLRGDAIACYASLALPPNMPEARTYAIVAACKAYIDGLQDAEFDMDSIFENKYDVYNYEFSPLPPKDPNENS